MITDEGPEIEGKIINKNSGELLAKYKYWLYKATTITMSYEIKKMKKYIQTQTACIWGEEWLMLRCFKILELIGGREILTLDCDKNF